MSVAEAQAKVTPMLEQLRQALEAADAPEGSAEGTPIVKEAIAAPTKGKVEKVVDWLKSAKEGGDAVAGLGALAASSHDKLAPLVHHLPKHFLKGSGRCSAASLRGGCTTALRADRKVVVP